jgi:hypothetical protein
MQTTSGLAMIARAPEGRGLQSGASLPKGEMRAASMVIGEDAGGGRSGDASDEDDHVILDIRANGSDHTLNAVLGATTGNHRSK